MMNAQGSPLYCNCVIACCPLGTLLPIAIGMILINGLDPMGLFFSIGIFFILSGLYYGITVPVQPMKVIGAYAVAIGLTPTQIVSSSLWMGILILFFGFRPGGRFGRF